MSSLSQSSVLLTFRGTAIPQDQDQARELHNRTAGSAEGIAAARSLGDLSHKVYVPVLEAGTASANELLFIDVWQNPQGLGTFFADAQVQAGADMLFSAREAAVWMPAVGAFGFELAAPMHQSDCYIGLVRGSVADPAAAVEVFRTLLEPKLGDARRLGQLSHQLYVSLLSGDDADTVELLGVDLWADAQGMQEHYAALSGYDAAFRGEPTSSVWRQASPGNWTEW